jgi:hypothetical protein
MFPGPVLEEQRCSISLWPGRSRDRIPVRDEIFRTGHGFHPTSVHWVPGLFPWGKAAEQDVHPPRSGAEIKESRAIHVRLPPLWVFMACCRANLFDSAATWASTLAWGDRREHKVGQAERLFSSEAKFIFNVLLTVHHSISV